MKKETPRSLKAQGRFGGRFEDSGARHGIPTTGRDLGKAQSERAKRGLRHTDPSVASSARSSGAGSRDQMGSSRRLGSGLQDRGRHGNGLAPRHAGWGVRPMPSDNSHQPAMTFSLNNYGLSLEAFQF